MFHSHVNNMCFISGYLEGGHISWERKTKVLEKEPRGGCWTEGRVEKKKGSI